MSSVSSVHGLNNEISLLESQINGIRAIFEPGPHRDTEIANLNARIATLRGQISSLLIRCSGG